jgi:hypothetical protein
MTNSIQSHTQSQIPAQPTPTPQIIQVQLPPQSSQPTPYPQSLQGDIGTFLVLIALTVLVKLLTDKS